MRRGGGRGTAVACQPQTCVRRASRFSVAKNEIEMESGAASLDDLLSRGCHGHYFFYARNERCITTKKEDQDGGKIIKRRPETDAYTQPFDTLWPLAR